MGPRYLVGGLIDPHQMSLMGLSSQACCALLHPKARQMIQGPPSCSPAISAPYGPAREANSAAWPKGAALAIQSAGSSALVWSPGEAQHFPQPLLPFYELIEQVFIECH